MDAEIIKFPARPEPPYEPESVVEQGLLAELAFLATLDESGSER